MWSSLGLAPIIHTCTRALNLNTCAMSTRKWAGLQGGATHAASTNHGRQPTPGGEGKGGAGQKGEEGARLFVFFTRHRLRGRGGGDMEVRAAQGGGGGK